MWHEGAAVEFITWFLELWVVGREGRIVGRIEHSTEPQGHGTDCKVGVGRIRMVLHNVGGPVTFRPSNVRVGGISRYVRYGDLRLNGTTDRAS